MLKKNYFYALPYYEFQSNSLLIDEINKDLLDSDKLYENPNTYNQSLRTKNYQNFYNENFYEWVINCLFSIKKDLFIPSTLELVITDCWINKTSKLQGHHIHTHPNSFLSGIFYLTSHISAKTSFIFDNYWYDSLHLFNIPKPPIEIQITPEAGKMILFPSHIKHKVSALTSDEIRYSVSFNVFFSGTFSTENGTMLTISTNSIKSSV